MKIKIRHMDYHKAAALPRPAHKKPKKPSFLLSTVVRLASIPGLLATRFRYEKVGMEKVGNQPCLILMNHTSFLDLSIASAIFYPKRHCIVCTYDALVGKSLLLEHLGCIPTQKFVSDMTLVQDMLYALKKKKVNVLMYPEAGYTFDGTATTLPKKLGVILKKLDVPVVMVTTYGVFAQNPLYNCLQKRKTKITARAECLASLEEVRALSPKELSERVEKAFSFDALAWQKEQGIEVTEPFRADGLNRILYQCPHCKAEGQMEGKGIYLTCHTCGKKYELTPLGQMKALEGETEFPHIPHWYAWERQQVRQSLLDGSYRLDVPVKIAMMVDYKAIYMVGEGRLTHDLSGFTLTGCEGRLHYTQGPLASYSLCSDYYWYEIGDVVCIGGKDRLYYLFPEGKDVVTKTRLAVEELYKLVKEKAIQLPKEED